MSKIEVEHVIVTYVYYKYIVFATSHQNLDSVE